MIDYVKRITGKTSKLGTKARRKGGLPNSESRDGRSLEPPRSKTKMKFILVTFS